MIYLDSSVLLAELLSEDRRASSNLWDQELTSSRLLQYETWNRLHMRGFGQSHAAEAAWLLDKCGFLELTPMILRRALEPFPITVRTLDGLHLATMTYLRDAGAIIEVASFDDRLTSAARLLGIPAYLD
jgi:predicted nucleic acid-binding protein